MLKSYADCFYCGGHVEERRGTREFRWQGDLFVFEDVPMGVCTQCGEKFLKPQVAKALDRMVQERRKPVKIIRVPVYYYTPEMA